MKSLGRFAPHSIFLAKAHKKLIRRHYGYRMLHIHTRFNITSNFSSKEFNEFNFKHPKNIGKFRRYDEKIFIILREIRKSKSIYLLLNKFLYFLWLFVCFS